MGEIEMNELPPNDASRFSQLEQMISPGMVEWALQKTYEFARLMSYYKCAMIAVHCIFVMGDYIFICAKQQIIDARLAEQRAHEEIGQQIVTPQDAVEILAEGNAKSPQSDSFEPNCGLIHD